MSNLLHQNKELKKNLQCFENIQGECAKKKEDSRVSTSIPLKMVSIGIELVAGFITGFCIVLGIGKYFGWSSKSYVVLGCIFGIITGANLIWKNLKGDLFD